MGECAGFYYRGLVEFAAKPVGDNWQGKEGFVCGAARFLAGVVGEDGMGEGRSGITGRGGLRPTEDDVRVAIQVREVFLKGGGVVEGLVRVCVGVLMVATAEDLGGWGEDPEGYMVEVERATAEEDVRAAGQGLLMALVEAEESKRAVKGFLVARMRDYGGQMEAAAREAKSAGEVRKPS